MRKLIAICLFFIPQVEAKHHSLSPEIREFGGWDVMVEKSWNPNETINCVFHDQEGLIWYGGSQGLKLMAGSRVQSVLIQSDATPGSEQVTSINEVEGEPGIWFTTYNGIGFVTPDYLVAQFTLLNADGETGRFQDLEILDDGRFCLLYEGAVFIYDKKTGEYSRHDYPVDFSSFRRVLVDRTTPNRILITGQVSSLITLDLDTGEWGIIGKQNPMGMVNSLSICQDLDGMIWVGCSRNWLIRVDPKTNQTKRWQISNYPGGAQLRLNALQIDKSGSGIWIGSSLAHHLMYFDIGEEKLYAYSDPERAKSFSDFCVTDITIDRFGYLWFSTLENGLLRARKIETKFSDSILDPTFQVSSRLIELPIGLELYNGQPVIHSKSGLSRLTKADVDMPVERLVASPRRNYIGLQGIMPSGDELYGLFHDKLARLVEGEWQVESEFPNGEMPRRSVIAGQKDGLGRIWFASGHDLMSWDPASKKLEARLTTKRWIEQIAVDNDWIWLATRDSLYRWDRNTGEKVEYHGDRNLGANCLLVDEATNTLWFGTKLGLIAVNRSDLSIKRFDDVQGNVGSLVKGSEDLLWMLIGMRLRPFDPQLGQMLSFRAQNEFEPSLRRFKSLNIDTDGNLFLGSWNSIIKIPEIDLLSREVEALPIRLVDARKITKNGIVPMHQLPSLFEESRSLTLESSDLGFEVDIFVPDYMAPEHVSYQYRIGDSALLEAKDGRIKIGSLPSGKHDLYVEAFDSRGVPASNSIGIELQSKAPFWLRPIFFLLVGAGLFGVGMGIHWLRLRFVLQNKRQLEVANRVLQETEARYRGVFNASSDGILVLDSDFQVLTGNQKAESLFGIDTNVGQKARWDLKNRVKNIDDIDAILNEASKGEEINKRPLRIIRVDDKPLKTLVTVTTSAGGEIRLHIRDISKEAELEAQMKHAQKMDAVGTLAGGIAHDFNNLLSPIILHSQFALECLNDKGASAIDTTIESLTICEEAARKAAWLVRDLLQFAKKPEDEEETIDLRESCQSSIRLLRGSIPSNVQIKTDLPDQRVPIQCSAHQFEQCLTNLGVNAGHAIGTSAGEIRISLKSTDKKNKQGQPMWKLTIADTGCGMDEETLARVFEPFFTTKEVGKGTGLGLAMVHGFIESARGDIRINSEPGQGTSFSLFLPESSQPLEKVESRGTDGLPVEKSPVSAHLLVVDDDPMVLKATSMILKKKGFEVKSFATPEEALSYVESGPETLDLVVSDQMMPGMTGLELAEKVREVDPDLPFVLLTGFCEAILEKEADSRVDAIHMKPLDYAALQTTISSLTQARDSALAMAG